MLMFWHNFQTGEADHREAPTTDEDAIQYIPQLEAAQRLYECLRLQGKGILEAMKETLTACLPAALR
jgi:hypothetical protein